MDVWENTTLGDGDAAHELVELFVVSDGELQVSWSDSRLLVVSCGVAGKLQDFGREVPERAIVAEERTAVSLAPNLQRTTRMKKGKKTL